MHVGKRLASVVTGAALVCGGVFLGEAPAQAATCNHELQEISVPGGYTSYWCWANEAHGTVQDTRPDGKCAYVDTWWGDSHGMRTYKACGFGTINDWDRTDMDGSIHISLRTA
jgi:hypothetical protein